MEMGAPLYEACVALPRRYEQRLIREGVPQERGPEADLVNEAAHPQSTFAPQHFGPGLLDI